MRFFSGHASHFFLVVFKSLTQLMKNAQKLSSWIYAAALLCTSFSYGDSKVEGEKPEFDDLPSPEFQYIKNKRFTPNDWLEVEAKIKVQVSPEPKSKTLGTMVVKWYVAVKNPEKAGTFLLLTKSVNHVNIPLNEDIYTSAYLSPGSIRLLTGTPRGGKNAVELVGYEVLVDGEIKAASTNKGKAGWWKVASPKISASDSVPLLAKNETPFASFWWDRSAEVKPEKY
jgi:hypothetical protein